MSLLYIPNEAANEILTATITFSSEDTNLPWDNLKNPQGWFAGRMNVAAADDYVHANLGSSKALTFCLLFFHNLDAGITVELRRGSSGATLVSTMTKQSPAFYSTFSATDQHWRLKFVGTNSAKIYLGKWVLGSHSTLTNKVDSKGYKVTEIREQLRAAKSMPPQNQTKFPRRHVQGQFVHKSVAERNEVRDLYRDSGNGEEAMAVVPDDNDTTTALYCRTAGDWAYTQDGLIYRSKIVLEEDAGPVIVS